MKTDRLAPYVGLGRTRNSDSFAFEVVCPEHTVAATYGAIAGGGSLGHPVKPPLNCTAVAGTLDHIEFSGSIYRAYSIIVVPARIPK